MKCLKLWFLLVLCVLATAMSSNLSPSVEGILVTHSFQTASDVQVSIQNERPDDITLCIIVIQDNILYYEANTFWIGQGEIRSIPVKINPAISSPAMMMIYEYGSSPSGAIRYILE